MAERLEGRIVKALSGFYYVGDAAIECRARGRFRKEEQTPLVGDRVLYSVNGSKGVIEELLPRTNAFIRPAVANLDLLVIFASEAIPITDPFLIDRVTAIAGLQDVGVLICINKTDLDPGDRLVSIYRAAGYPVIQTSAETGAGIGELREQIRGKTAAFTGNSGVGKSSVLNLLSPGLDLPTGEVSEKLGRGRHTTRHVELFPLGEGTYVADTPGFSAFDTEQTDLRLKNALASSFPDFGPYLGRCQFRDCAHHKEPGCAVTAAVAAGEIQKTRYDSYIRLYQTLKEIPDWK